MKIKSQSTLFAIIFHIIIVIFVLIFAAKDKIEKTLKTINVTFVPKEKKVEIPKQSIPIVNKLKNIEIPPPIQEKVPEIKQNIIPSVAPPPVQIPSFNFSDGAKSVTEIKNPIQIYKLLIERKLKDNWIKPDDLDKSAEIRLFIDKDGEIIKYSLIKSSGDSIWDASVSKAVNLTQSIGRPPPINFPLDFIIIFDTIESE